jgi:alpha-L-fucosidase
MTLNNSWGYNKNDFNYKSADNIIYTLINCVSKNGNLLLNVGPDARGRIPQRSVDVLEEVGAWMKDNHEGIYGCGPAQLEKPEWGWYTQKGNSIYAHITNYNVGPVCLKNLNGKIKSVISLSDGSEIKPGEISNVNTNGPYVGKDDTFINLRQMRPASQTSDPIKVVKLELIK